MSRAIPRGFLWALAAAALAVAPVAYAQQKDFKPHVGQQGKDVVWVPTPDEVVERMLNMAQTKPEDYVIDLGAGDGKIAIAAAKKFGARSLGVEYNPDMVAHAQRNAHGRRLSGAVAADKTEQFTGTHVEGDRIQCDDFAVPLGNPVDLKRHVSQRRSPRR